MLPVIQTVIANPAGEIRLHSHPVPFFEIPDLSSCFPYNSGKLMSRDNGIGSLVVSLIDMKIRPAYAAGIHLYQDLILLRFGNIDLYCFQCIFLLNQSGLHFHFYSPNTSF